MKLILQKLDGVRKVAHATRRIDTISDFNVKNSVWRAFRDADENKFMKLVSNPLCKTR